MATVTGLTAEKMLEIEGASIIDGRVESGELILIQHDGDEINVGPISGPQGPPGPIGPAGISAIPGEVKLWPGNVLPDLEDYGKWVWADGHYYPNASHPKAADVCGVYGSGSKWRTFDGASDPGASNFRVPDLRGLVAAGLDQMPAGSPVGRANRMTRGVAITVAERTGRETYDLKVSEMPRHGHGNVSIGGTISGRVADDGNHQHIHRANHITQGRADGGSNMLTGLAAPGGGSQSVFTDLGGSHGHDKGTLAFTQTPGSGAVPEAGSDPSTAHENVQPTVFVPYIVYLDVV